MRPGTMLDDGGLVAADGERLLDVGERAVVATGGLEPGQAVGCGVQSVALAQLVLHLLEVELLVPRSLRMLELRRHAALHRLARRRLCVGAVVLAVDREPPVRLRRRPVNGVALVALVLRSLLEVARHRRSAAPNDLRELNVGRDAARYRLALYAAILLALLVATDLEPRCRRFR